jgi:hypothetical protein
VISALRDASKKPARERRGHSCDGWRGVSRQWPPGRKGRFPTKARAEAAARSPAYRRVAITVALRGTTDMRLMGGIGRS